MRLIGYRSSAAVLARCAAPLCRAGEIVAQQSRSISHHRLASPRNGRSGSRRVVALAAQGDSSFLGGFYAGTA